MSARKQASSGFTLIEILVTIVILVIFLTIGVPSFRGIMMNTGIKSASFDLFSALEYTRSEAIKRNGVTVVSLCAGDTAANNGSWIKGWRADIVASCDSVTPLRSWTVPSNVTVAQKAASTATPVQFSKDGRVTSTAPKLQIDPARSLNGVDSRCIQIDLSGRPSTQKGTCP